MSKTVLFFPGQASQYVGMGKDLYGKSKAVRDLYDYASDVIGYDFAKLSFEGPENDLTRTSNTQPAILLHSLAVLTLLKNNMPEFDYAAGHSLGEYVALAAAGAMTFKDAIRAVVKRAQLMEKACQDNPGTMAATMGLSIEKIEEVCEKASVKGIVIPANFNSTGQIVISGSLTGVEEAVSLAKNAGAKRAIILQVGGAFHSPLMQQAQPEMEKFLSEIDIVDPKKPVIANVTAKEVNDADSVRKLLVEQITAPVKWSQTMSYLVEKDVTKVIEIGPGKVLSSLAKREMRPETLVNIDKLEDLNIFETVVS